METISYYVTSCASTFLFYTLWVSGFTCLTLAVDRFPYRDTRLRYMVLNFALFSVFTFPAFLLPSSLSKQPWEGPFSPIISISLIGLLLCVYAVHVLRRVKQVVRQYGNRHWSILIANPKPIALADLPTHPSPLQPKVFIATTPAIPVPFSTGFHRHKIYLDKEWETLPAGEQRSVLYHEYGHGIFDQVSSSLQTLASILFWWNPVIQKLLDHRLTLLRELCCDEAAITKASIETEEYCGMLIHYSEKLSARYASTKTSLLGNNKPRILVERINHILDPHKFNVTREGWHYIAPALLGLLALFPLFVRGDAERFAAIGGVLQQKWQVVAKVPMLVEHAQREYYRTDEDLLDNSVPGITTEKNSQYYTGITPNAPEDKMRSSLTATGLSILALATGCTDSMDTKSLSASTSVPPSAEATPPPIKIAVMLDKTGSMLDARVLNAAPEDFGPLVDLLSVTGGEIAVGAIRDTSDQVLLRLRIEAPPVAPIAPIDSGNRFIFDEKRGAYEAKLKVYNTLLENREGENAAKRKAFRSKLQRVTSQKADAPNTDLYGATMRAELFLNEPDLTWPRPTRRYLILETDGLDNVQKLPITIRSNATVIVVNGTGNLGALAPLNPVPFESLEAAFRSVVADVKSAGGGTP